MTREEAKELLIHVLMTYEPRDQYGDLDDSEPYEEAMTMAIEALSEPKTGKWVRCKKQNKADLDNGNALYECSNCGHTDLHAETQEVPYCWWCGAKMGGDSDG